MVDYYLYILYYYVDGEDYMKLLISSLVLIAVLAGGCSSNESKEPKVCTVETNEQTGTFEIIPEGNKVKTIIATLQQDYEGASELSDDDKSALDAYMASAMGIAGDSGVTLKIEYGDNVIKVVLTFDVQNIKEMPSIFQSTTGTADDLKEISFDNFIKDLETAGAECE